MGTLTESAVIKACLLQIEAGLNWGPVTNWTNYDFEKLSEAIDEKTGVVLSVTTLKRIWGKVKYEHSPTLTTLNTLAGFLGFEDWRSFTNSIPAAIHEEVVSPGPEPVKVLIPFKQKKRSLPVAYIIGIFLFLFAVSFLIFSGRKQAPVIDSSKFQFSADKIISKGVPNSVIFTYDATAANTDSVYIVQTWDISRKTLVSKHNKKHSAIYYYPGFFRTKLIIDSTIVKTYNLQISTDGWLCLAENESMPLYFKKEEFQRNGEIEIDSSILTKYNLPLHPSAPRIRFFNQGDLGDLMNDNFVFETKLKNEFQGGTNACQFVQVLIQCKDDIIIIPLSAKTCAGDLNLYACGKSINSRNADLSRFGTNLNEWTKLRVETKQKEMKLYVNDQLASSFIFPNDPTGIVGVQYRFNGPGAVSYAWFENRTGRKVLE